MSEKITYKKRFDMTPKEKAENDWLLEMIGLAQQVIDKWGENAITPLGKLLDSLKGLWPKEGELMVQEDMDKLKTAILKVLETGKLD